MKLAKAKRLLAETIVKVLPWEPKVTPWPKKAVIIGAPHTSNLDAAAMILIMWLEGREFNFLVKDSVMKAPVIGTIAAKLGGIGVNRSTSNGLISSLHQIIEERDTLTLCITPKGTRARREYWKSGFYRIALENKLPVAFGFLDSKTKTFGVGPTIELSWDVVKDMDKIRAFYTPMAGINAELSCIPRLKAEDDPEAAAYLLRPLDEQPLTESTETSN